MHWNVLRLAQGLSVQVEQGGGTVAPLLDVGGVGCANQRLAHFLRDRGQRAANNFDGDWIDHAAARNRRMRSGMAGVLTGSRAPHSSSNRRMSPKMPPDPMPLHQAIHQRPV